jgi:uncharacterized Zn-binding protein involved in type VI secretion
MSGLPAARVGDAHECPAVTVIIPHVGGPVLGPGAATVLVGGEPGARIGDPCFCLGPADAIVKGAMPVRMINMPAARISDLTAHGGNIIVGCPTVLIGLAGISGNVLAGKKICAAMKAGRNPAPGALGPGGQQLQPNTAGQSYNNCGIEVSRQIITQSTGQSPTQEQLFNGAQSNGWATSVPGNPYASGGTVPAGRQSIMGQPPYNVQTTQVPPTMGNLETAVSEGKGVSTDVWASNLPTWAGQNLAPNTGAHNLLVTGVEYDDNGNPINVIINDTGMGQCGVSIPYAQFQAALIGGGNNHVVTNNPMW